MEKLHINNFAGFKSVELEIRPVTGFIGPQASGKSVIAKLLYFFREIASRLPNVVLNEHDGQQYREECCKRFGLYFPIQDTGLADFEITYLINDQFVRVNFATRLGDQEQSLSLAWSSFYDAALKKFASRKFELLGGMSNMNKDVFMASLVTLRGEAESDIATALGHWANYEQIFIPAGRSFFSQLQGMLFTQLGAGGSLDPFMVAFGSLLAQSKFVLESSGFFELLEGLNPGDMGKLDVLRPAFTEILRAQLRRFEKQDFLEFRDGRRVKLAQASSGQQEALPLLLLMARFVWFSRSRGCVVYIEEPEAHLFPSTQKLIMELMAGVFRAWKGEMSLVLTTHSPYILTSINNLLEAGKLYAGASKGTAARLTKIIPRDRTLIPGEIGFYSLEDGKAKSIVDSESGLIEADLIDQVSNDIAIEFDQLLAEGNEKS
jgi:hypothetical protein